MQFFERAKQRSTLSLMHLEAHRGVSLFLYWRVEILNDVSYVVVGQVMKWSTILSFDFNWYRISIALYQQQLKPQFD